MRSLKSQARRLSLHRSYSPATTASSSSTAPSITPIASLMIANRGEIALRIHKTAHRLGIQTATVYTDPDASSQHAAVGNYSFNLGPAKGYLDTEKIIGLAKAHGIQALHPGYGFLSENPAFAARCEQEGIVFVGPPAQAMADMGHKARSKEIMESSGVPCVPGYHGPQQGEDQLLGHARKIGFPVLLKSVRGGGGKGMRIVKTESEFLAQLRSARAEANASFGDGGEVMLVERYIERPRHVEVQIFADKYGNCVALGERDCSIQRRHQKILEESPAPHLDASIRADLWSKARTAALAVGYVGAGTVEFILDKDSGQFFFMEMNTRLQVEHPVSEMVTGTDLVEWQVRIASGEKLPLTQSDIEKNISARGAAIEARIYAEKPEEGFMPDSGKLIHLRTPATNEDVRIDAGFGEGDVVTEAYDGMIAKLIVRADDRTTAIQRLDRALAEYEIVGLGTNIEFLKRLCQSPAFVQGDVETGFIEKHHDELFAAPLYQDEVFVQGALALLLSAADEAQTQSFQTLPAGANLGFGGIANPGEADSIGTRSFSFKVLDVRNESEVTAVVTLYPTGNRMYDVNVTTKAGNHSDTRSYKSLTTSCALSAESSAKADVTTYFPQQRITSKVVTQTQTAASDQTTVVVFQHGKKHELELLSPTWYDAALGIKKVSGAVVAPMPCKILKVEVGHGQEVKRGDPLIVIESMKMETVIKAPHDGRVKRVVYQPGDICKARSILVEFEDD
ncbi:Methylcrotonoyl-CoA carboxylase subunit alpha mitochondrial [Ceratocystis lukuohia]|uniref:Methylcrotonoyl-CoA carboxylase subunit alpha mitochondrial n=1 Tax=Ceratocystis lukuohia TaxID=2019550 RepID=A0ABR4MHB6_9PEZI